jgi:hypothetical protein
LIPIIVLSIVNPLIYRFVIVCVAVLFFSIITMLVGKAKLSELVTLYSNF